ncbi:exodeoxyribonuclease 7 small subunit [Celeribacter indicus]|uniref:Exodeoxyribonuclease 7 small subunit n=2 Tax=Celeribacter indicus TaxID=1208324 RepID=A0A0B5DP94_9RHOB|nr:exodeoxyribonuclease 7 small subunit [Celeribacter indicus]
MSFEQAMAELDQVVSKLERGDVALEDSIRLYERGAALKAHCERKLKEAEEKVEKITVGPDGNAAGTSKADV